MMTLSTDNQPIRVSDKEMLLLGDDPEVWRMAYERSRELQQEFLDFGCFPAYLKSMKNGQSHVCQKAGVVRSRQADQPKTFLAN